MSDKWYCTKVKAMDTGKKASHALTAKKLGMDTDEFGCRGFLAK